MEPKTKPTKLVSKLLKSNRLLSLSKNQINMIGFGLFGSILFLIFLLNVRKDRNILKLMLKALLINSYMVIDV